MALQKFEVAKQGIRLNGVMIEADPKTGHARHIKRISLPLP